MFYSTLCLGFQTIKATYELSREINLENGFSAMSLCPI